MDTQYIETLIIGAGQAGLSTGYHLRRRGRPLLIVDANPRVGDNWRQQWDTLRLYTPAKYDGLPGLPFPAARWHCPQKDEVGDYLETVRAALRPARAYEHPGGTPQGAAGRRVPRDGRRREDQLRQRGGGHRHLRAHAERARIRRRTRPVDPATALEPVPAARPAPTRAGAGSRRLALGAGHRLRARRVRADDPVRSEPRQHPVPPRIPAGTRAHAGGRVRLQARADPADPDRPQGDARGALARRSQPSGSSTTTWTAGAWSATRPG